MKKLLFAASAVLFLCAAARPVAAQVATGFQDQVSGVTKTLPVTPARPLPVTGAGVAASAKIDINTAVSTELVALSAGKVINVTQYNAMAGGTGNISWVYGTGTACATGRVALTGAYVLTAQNGISVGDGIAPVLVVPAGNALCALTTQAVQMSGSVAYAQFTP